MSLNIKKATDITHDAATYLIYAQPGMGKTTAIKYLKGKTLIIDVDKSSSVLKGEADRTYPIESDRTFKQRNRNSRQTSGI